MLNQIGDLAVPFTYISENSKRIIGSGSGGRTPREKELQRILLEELISERKVEVIKVRCVRSTRRLYKRL